ncbi:hypothetical protein PTKIN_Ptkin18bG0049000 [Pterospermum kingtungense]
MDQMFPIIDPKARPTAKPKIFFNLLWNQLSHLGNAGFDPEEIRVDPYGNVLYYHADSDSPLAWDIDHWFPCSRGGLSVASNLRILQWQVCKKKHNKLEFQVPWWDFQLGISVNQFLSIFASRNSDFRHRAFSFLFAEGENQEINSSQTVDSHSFPQHFMKSKQQFGVAPAAVVVTRQEPYDTSSPLKSLNYNRQIRPQSPIIASRKMKSSILKENENPDFAANPYQAIVMARDSLKQREEAHKRQAEIKKLDEEVNEMRLKNDEEKLSIQDLEMELIKHRRRAEKCRRLAEAQSSYRTMLEKMIRDAMHQSVVYKEQVRLNQAAANALMARLEAQKAMCDASEKELHKKFKQRDELEKQVRPEWEQARKRSRMEDTFFDSKSVLYLPGIRPRNPSHKELGVFLEEENKANEDQKNGEHYKAIAALEDEKSIEEKFERLGIEEIQFPVVEETEREEDEDEESRKRRGKGNVERWLQMLLENTQEELNPHQNEDAEEVITGTDEIIKKLDLKYPHKEKDVGKKKEESVETEGSKTPRRSSSTAWEVASVAIRKERNVMRSETARAVRQIPSSPSLILGGMKKGVECMRKKPIVTTDDEEGNNFLKSSIKTLKKKAVKI